LGILATAAAFPVVAHLVLAGVVGAALLLWAMRAIAPGVGRVDAAERAAQATTPRPAIWKDTRLVLIGGIVLAMALAEGTANDWLPLVMVDGHGFDATMGSTVFALFAAAMTAGRFAGGPVVARVGRSRVLGVSALFAATGLALISFVDSQPVALVAVVLWGLGASLGFPLAPSAAGDAGPNPAARVALASTIGYLAFLVGPPTLGLLGEEVGLRGAPVVPLAVVLVAVLLAPATAPRPAGGAEPRALAEATAPYRHEHHRRPRREPLDRGAAPRPRARPPLRRALAPPRGLRPGHPRRGPSAGRDGGPRRAHPRRRLRQRAPGRAPRPGRARR